MKTWIKFLTALPLALCAPVALADTFNIVVVDDIYSMNDVPFESSQLETATLDWLRILDRVIYSPEPLYFALSDTAFTDGTLGRGTGSGSPPTNYGSEYGLSTTLRLPVALTIVVGADTPNNINANLGVEVSSVPDWDLTVDLKNPPSFFMS